MNLYGALLAAVLLSPVAADFPETRGVKMRITAETLGIMGTGSNMFRCGLAHSSGVVYIGTYGPQPAIIWKYDPKTGKLTEVGRPGEYQLDSMVEAPNGIVYIGTAYNALVYRLDPKTDRITSLGTPPVESTPWIFTMLRTRGGQIYGAKGVGLFRLDWEKDRLEAVGLVPGDHRTPPPGGSSPIVRMLSEAPDGRIYGDTNRWLFRFDPKTRKVELLADMVAVDDACYGLMLPDAGEWSDNDCRFLLYTRYSGRELKRLFYVFRAATGKVEPLEIEGWTARSGGGPTLFARDGRPRMLIAAWHDDESTRLHEVDAESRKVVTTWHYADADVGLSRLRGPGWYFMTSTPGKLLQADPEKRTFRVLAENPVPVECRSLAASPNGLLGTDTYDCGFMFTRDLGAGAVRSHGRVWIDDHRCNYGPAAFGGAAGRYFLANHSEALQGLWVTDTEKDRHWRLGPPAVQLVRFSDGSVWGTHGPNPAGYRFDAGANWIASWASRPGQAFRYEPGAAQAEPVADLGNVGCLAESPAPGRVLAARGDALLVFDPREKQTVQTLALDAPAVALARDPGRPVAYLLLADRSLHACRQRGAELVLDRLAASFGPTDRGFFVLPASGRLVGLGTDGAACIFDRLTAAVTTVTGPAPLPAGPAVDPRDDAWYFADRNVVRYRLAGAGNP